MRRLRRSERGASPVIGVILMVAVAVILAAIIGAFVLDVGGDQSTVPSAKFTFDYNDSGYLTITQSGGQVIDDENALELRVEYTNGSGATTQQWPLPVSSGKTLTLDDPPKSGTKVRVIWRGPDGDSSEILASDRVP